MWCTFLNLVGYRTFTHNNIVLLLIVYLICMPMLEEWKEDAGIWGLDGWTFQVSVDHLLHIRSLLI